jgi:peptidoglycan hydrolase CwlO-like protein
MNSKNEIQKLMKARQRIERKLRELDAKIEHLRFRLDDERACMSRKCPLDDDDPLLP